MCVLAAAVYAGRCTGQEDTLSLQAGSAAECAMGSAGAYCAVDVFMNAPVCRHSRHLTSTFNAHTAAHSIRPCQMIAAPARQWLGSHISRVKQLAVQGPPSGHHPPNPLRLGALC